FASLFDRELRAAFEKRGVWGVEANPPNAILAPKIEGDHTARAPSIAPAIALFAGAGVAAIGAGLSVYGLATSDGDIMQACLVHRGPTAACPSTPSPLAIGIGMFAAGGVTAILGLIFGEEDESDAR